MILKHKNLKNINLLNPNLGNSSKNGHGSLHDQKNWLHSGVLLGLVIQIRV